ncbi:pyrroloquinoline quinone biosynthesis protein PqqF [Pseudomonas sp. CDFA 602]|uniref:pyrroloquinoline quinone biosynthesis protein PqqF n=1 Tax=Pseudomonas californiensis TaxID=2829823 RepID=UPI001E33451A|nr:pyrroloquinoline quinone biosynthesis protein PqqF [Pseudomonas californiensis]MCD5995290.1 pyrroloquinoline quinone biosynthesis protein PqqF [Pseudomonas californiensis]MCD6000879.1 pyrroloquinoline quinone biosynthesis protein PqqF [Pseudomonas californiensis]
MQHANISDIERLVLANGLNVVLCHNARLKRCAASLRVAAGSHDVPQAWPGLAHFLEHLLFLGTERFAADQNLMAFVQRHGGLVNASTRERTTDFFFELPQAVFAQGLERLCDMLAHPRMALAEQLREREVLHAEFIAWAGDAEARHQTRLLAPINAQHPLRGFHAGNRYSLSVPNPAFQHALNDFYKRFYQAGQMTLCLSGPQSLAELHALAAAHGALLKPGERVAQRPPPPLLDARQNLCSTDFHDRLHLLFACEGLPEKADEAVAFFCHWLNTTQAGGLAAALIERELIHSLKASPLYQFDGQLLLDIDLQAASTDVPGKARIARLFFSWLSFFNAQWPALIEEYQRLQQRRLHTAGALALAHHYCRDTPSELSEQGVHAMSVLLKQLTPEALVCATVDDTATAEQTDWRLPPTNPFLRPLLLPAQKTTHRALVCNDELPQDSAEATVYLRWELQCPQPTLWQMLDSSLKDLVEDAWQAGVNVSFSRYGNYWQLKLSGVEEPFAAVIQQCLQRLLHPDSKTLARYGKPASGPVQIPIRELLKQLPDLFLTSTPAPASDDLQAVWAGSSWIGFGAGLSAVGRDQVNAVLTTLPGTQQKHPTPLPASRSGKRWEQVVSSSAENAVLVFCPAPDTTAEDEAAWRMLAHVIQAPFYQRLRVELQLGYAVFSGLRQIAGTTGLLFGVQSPNCDTAELVRHIETLLNTLPELIAHTHLPEQRRALIAQLDLATLPDEQAAEWLWQAYLGGRGADRINALRNALSNLDTHSLLAAANVLNAASNGWLIVANRPACAPFA